MLSINDCKKYLNKGKRHYSDKETEEIRDTLYQATEILVEKFLQEKYQANTHQKKNSKFPIQTYI